MDHCRQAPKLHQDTFGRYDGKPLELQTGNLPFRRAFLAHAAVAVNARTRAGDLRADLQLDQRHWQSRSETAEKPGFNAWLTSAMKVTQ